MPKWVAFLIGLWIGGIIMFAVVSSSDLAVVYKNGEQGLWASFEGVAYQMVPLRGRGGEG